MKHHHHHRISSHSQKNVDTATNPVVQQQQPQQQPELAIAPPAAAAAVADPVSATAAALTLVQPLETVFVKEVRAGGPAAIAGLQNGDRLLSVNGMSVAGMPYNRVVAAIQQAPPTLTLHVVPKECDILQTVSGTEAFSC